MQTTHCSNRQRQVPRIAALVALALYAARNLFGMTAYGGLHDDGNGNAGTVFELPP